MNILVINTGSSSIKYRLINMDNGSTVCSGLVERIGEPVDGRIEHKIAPGAPQAKEITKTMPFPDHRAGFAVIGDLLGESGDTRIDAIGHRVVQGGDRFKETCLVTREVIEGIRALIPLAPVHNAGHVQGMETALEMFPAVRFHRYSANGANACAGWSYRNRHRSASTVRTRLSHVSRCASVLYP